ncbi:MAG: TrkH family potassium uptake protein [Selenomonadaceae bacterium]|nr:TrkH family potassium uptake protein [Selenomonadaceae bacterium]MBR4383747.1 TrkH family potassium uptake protein [Selenomonadaceae bacterium]
MNFKMILRIQSQALLTFAVIATLPMIYSGFSLGAFDGVIFFGAIGLSALCVGIFFSRFVVGRFQRAPLAESAAAVLIMYPLLAIFGCVPFLLTGWLSPLDALLETLGDLTSAGLSILPDNAPYILFLWQSSLMWIGSLLFLIILVTVLPEVSGCFGISLSLQGGQNFGSVIGQMNLMSLRVIKVYSTLTIFSVVLFDLAGFNVWDSILMAMRCISTGGGNFFPEHDSIYVEYAAIFVMLIACGNFLLYHRVIYTLMPPQVEFGKIFKTRIKNYVSRFRRTLFANAKVFFANEEIKVLYVTIFIVFFVVSVRQFLHGIYFDETEIFRRTLFHIVSFVSTTGISLEGTEKTVQDFDKFFVFLMTATGGCIGSVTGGFKIVRVIILFKITATEIRRMLHPKMMPAIKIGDVPVPIRTAGRILGFFFLALVTMFICAAFLSLSGKEFSTAVSISVACLTNVGNLPGLCDAEDFRTLSIVGKIFCMIILVVGRLEIFTLLIAVASIKFKRKKSNW